MISVGGLYGIYWCSGIDHYLRCGFDNLWAKEASGVGYVARQRMVEFRKASRELRSTLEQEVRSIETQRPAVHSEEETTPALKSQDKVHPD